MNPYSSLAPVLPHQHLYVLLALTRGELHGYDIYGAVGAISLGTVSMSTTRTYSALKAMMAAVLVEEAGVQEAGKQGKPRMTYRISPEGRLRLIDDLKRMRHAVEVGESAGLFFDELPSEIQRLINQLR